MTDWLTMPGWLFAAYSRMYARLAAEERLRGMEAAIIAAGMVKPEQVRATFAQLEAQASGPPDPNAPKRRTAPEELRAFLGGAGITPQRVQAKG